MSIQLAEGITLEGYNPLKDEDVTSLQDMFTSYLLEEFERIGEMAFGNPVAGYLVTFIIHCEGQEAGFLSVDIARHSVEVIYVKTESRGRRLATLALAALNQKCPQTLALKSPLSPGGERLAARLELDRADNAPDDNENEDALRTIQRSIDTSCPHKKKRTGDPSKPCKRCYRKGLRQYASAVIDRHAQGVRMTASS